MAAAPVQARWSVLHNASLAGISLAMVGLGIGHFVNNPASAPTISLQDQRFVLLFMAALALLYYVFLGISRIFKREPQVVIDSDGVWLGFGRNRRLAWDDIGWVRIRRLALRPQLEVGLTAPAFAAANLRLSPWSLDDNLRPVRGQPTTVLVRDNGLDTGSSALLDAVRSFRPNLTKL